MVTRKSVDENSASLPPRSRAFVRRLPHCALYPYQSDRGAIFLCFRLQDIPEKWGFISPEIRFMPMERVVPRVAIYRADTTSEDIALNLHKYIIKYALIRYWMRSANFLAWTPSSWPGMPVALPASSHGPWPNGARPHRRGDADNLAPVDIPSAQPPAILTEIQSSIRPLERLE
jgi:hypothetical protein